MARKRKLKWGETPFDKMTRKELLMTAKRMYSALVSVNSGFRMARDMQHMAEGIDPEVDPSPLPYWGLNGSGGADLEKARQVLGSIHEHWDSEDIYRSYYRYARDLLFERNGYRMLSFGWAICPECGWMVGESGSGESQVGKPCKELFDYRGCPGVFRALTWEDMQPHRKNGKTTN